VAYYLGETMSLLTIVQDAADDIGILRPTSVVGNGDEDVKKLLRMANKVGDRLMRVFDWQIISKEQTFTSVATLEQTSILPSDFDRFIPETFWNRTDIFLISGPITPSQWQGLIASSYSDTEARKFHIRGGSVYVQPVLGAGKTLAFEYVSKNWCQDASSTAQSAWAADTDTGIINEELITKGVIWEYLNSKGLPNAAQAAAYEEYFELLIKNDRPSSEVLVAGDIFGGSHTRHYTGAPPVSGRGGLF